jgi:hypothetical protein
VYCATVRAVEDLAFLSKKLRIPAEYYHGRLGKADRDERQEGFMKPGRRVVMLATNAFGLGVDKPDIRYVLHFHVPGSLEAYVQEAGRAGRDGKPSRCILLWSPDDVAIQEYFQEGNYPSGKQVRQVAEALQAWTDTDRAVGIRALATSGAVGEKRTRVVLDFLEENGWAREEEHGKWVAVGAVPEDMLALAGRWFDLKRIEDRRRLDALVAYAESNACRVRHMLDYFGEPGPERCGRCDNCRAAAKAAAGAAAGEGTAPSLEGGRKRKRRRGGRGRRRGIPPAPGAPAVVEGAERVGTPPEGVALAPGVTAPAQGAQPPGEPGRRRRRRRRGRGRGGQPASGGPAGLAAVPSGGVAGGTPSLGVPRQPGESAPGASTPGASEPAREPAVPGTLAATEAAGGGGPRRRRRRRRRRRSGGAPAGGGEPPAGATPS